MQSKVWQRIDELRAEIENAARYSDNGSEAIELAIRIQERLRQQRIEDERARKRRKQAISG